MNYFPHFVMRRYQYVLWQMGHYHYQITCHGEPIKTIMDSCENAVEILNTVYGE